MDDEKIICDVTGLSKVKDKEELRKHLPNLFTIAERARQDEKERITKLIKRRINMRRSQRYAGRAEEFEKLLKEIESDKRHIREVKLSKCGKPYCDMGDCDSICEK